MSTKLADYELYYDGSISVDPSSIHKYLIKVDPARLFVTEITQNITNYNKLAPPHQKIKCRVDHQPSLPVPAWNPRYTINLSDSQLYEYMTTLLVSRCKGRSIEYCERAVNRFTQEWSLFSQKGMFSILRVLIEVINTFTKGNIPWGPGRGSSTSSYLFFLIGLHNVDSILYDVDITDFIR